MIINLISGPGSGKTKIALRLTSTLKEMGRAAYFVQEVASDFIVQDNLLPLQICQPYVISNQLYRQECAIKKYEFVIVDSPILLGLIYNNEKNTKAKELFDNFIIEKFKDIESYNFFIERNNYFTMLGRIHNLEQSKEIDFKIKTILEKNNIKYDNIYSDESAVNKIIKLMNIERI